MHEAGQSDITMIIKKKYARGGFCFNRWFLNVVFSPFGLDPRLQHLHCLASAPQIRSKMYTDATCIQKEFETIAYDAKLKDEERTDHDSIEKWRLLRHLSRIDLKHFSHTVLERDSSLLYAACEMCKAEDPDAEVLSLSPFLPREDVCQW